MVMQRGQNGFGNENAERLANALGWASEGLGLPQVSAPGAFLHAIGVKETPTSRAITRVVGVRELAAGAGILTRPKPVGWLWARVTGDVMDIVLLSLALRSDKNRRGRVAAALSAVVGITALDLSAASRFSASRGHQDGAAHVGRAITINRPPEEVYRVWRDFRNLPRFMDHLESVEVSDDRRSHWRAKAPAGKTVEWDAEIVDDQPSQLIAWQSIGDADVHNAGSVRFDPAPAGRGTEVRVQVDYAPPTGAVGATVAKLFREEPGKQIRDDLFRFKQVVETGEVVRSEGSLDGPRLRQHPGQPPKSWNGS